MSIKDKVFIDSHYTRSINLERDKTSLAAVKAYIPTSRALRTLSRFASVQGDEPTPRAWSLVGPYGSGKSAFALFLSKLLSDPNSEVCKVAQKVLRGADAGLGKQYKKINNAGSGYLEILVTGSPEPLGSRLVTALHQAADSFWASRPGPSPKVVGLLKKASENKSIVSAETLDLVKQLQDQYQKAGGKGLLFVIDELGKFLEYEARHYGANDIYLLQSLAEHAYAGHKANLFLFVLLHQSFEQYAKGLGENLKNEWSKVQGRFEEIPFLESSEQVLRVVSAAFKYSLDKVESNKVSTAIDPVVRVLEEQAALPASLSSKDASALFLGCYPLHPVSAILLPLLCQKIAQNERTLFSYLGSNEEFGFQQVLSGIENIGDLVGPDQIFDYFITNQSAVMGDYLTHRRWAEVVTALERLGDAEEHEIRALKTIGILNIVGAKGGFKASKEVLGTVMSSSSLNKALKVLNAKSVINYRKFSGEYRVWQGSDFDLEGALQEELNNLGNFRLSEELNRSEPLMPVVARRYTIESGALRYFQPYFVDASTYKREAEKTVNTPRIIFYVAAGQDDEELFFEEVVNGFSESDIVALCLTGSQIREAVAERQALERVQSSRQELNTDAVAKREFEDRLSAARYAESEMLVGLLERPLDSQWFYKGEDQGVINKRQLQEVMSSILRSVYSDSPIFKNELINRDRPSSQANAARNKLLAAMVSHPGCEDLGIDKFPPEKAIYRSLIKETKLHKFDKNTGEWFFSEPAQRGKSNLSPAWGEIVSFLESTETQGPRSFAELNDFLMAPPYGIKAGVLPILYVSVFIVYQHELAIYENGQYRPHFTIEMIERFVKRPDEYTFQRFRITGMRASIFEQYAEVIHGESKERRNILDLARPLAGFMGSLPDYAKKTKRGLSADAQAVRSAFQLAKSPERLLFEQLPNALGLDAVNDELSSSQLSAFSERLKGALRELKDAYPKLKEEFQSLLSHAFNVDSGLDLKELRRVISGQCHSLENFTIDAQGLKAFLMRLNRVSGADDEWLENIMMFLGHKPPSKWLDSDHDVAEQRLSDFSRRVIDLEMLSLHEKSQTNKLNGDFDVYLLRSVKKGGDFLDEVVAVDKKTSERMAGKREEIEGILRDIGDKELVLSVLAEVSDQFLREYRQSGKKTKATSDQKTETNSRSRRK